MKSRKGFVTNSSSSSFIISKKYLNNEQIRAILKHSELGKMLNLDCCDYPWNIKEHKNYIYGHTYIDNFDMEEFLEKIDVNTKVVEWGAGEYDYDEYKDCNECVPEWIVKLYELENNE